MKVKFIVTILRTEAEVFVNQQIDTNVELLVAVAPHQELGRSQRRGDTLCDALWWTLGDWTPVTTGNGTFYILEEEITILSPLKPSFKQQLT